MNTTRRSVVTGLTAGALLPLLSRRALAAFITDEAVQAKVLVYSRGTASTMLVEASAGGSLRKESEELGGRYTAATVRRPEPLGTRELRLKLHAVNGAGSKWLDTAVVATDVVVIAFEAGGAGRAETVAEVKAALKKAGIEWGSRPTFFAIDTGDVDPVRTRDVHWELPDARIPVEPVRLSDGAGASVLMDRIDAALRAGLKEGVIPQVGPAGESGS